jgi:solute carrier family 25 oxoglutarate transporter 11
VVQADSGLPLDQRRNYKNVFDALIRITKEEGAMGLFAGATPTVVRAAVLNTGASGKTSLSPGERVHTPRG